MDKPSLAKFADEIPFEAIAQKMFVNDYEDLKFSGGKRRNLHYDAGYTAMNQTDSSVISGMNLPHRLFSTKAMAGLGPDKTFQHTLFKSGVNIMKILDGVQEFGRQTRIRGDMRSLHHYSQTVLVTPFLVATGQKTWGLVTCGVMQDLTRSRVSVLAKHCCRTQ